MRYLAEEGGGIGTSVRRQLMHTHRRFKAHILNKQGSQILYVLSHSAPSDSVRKAYQNHKRQNQSPQHRKRKQNHRRSSTGMGPSAQKIRSLNLVLPLHTIFPS